MTHYRVILNSLHRGGTEYYTPYTQAIDAMVLSMTLADIMVLERVHLIVGLIFISMHHVVACTCSSIGLSSII